MCQEVLRRIVQHLFGWKSEDGSTTYVLIIAAKDVLYLQLALGLTFNIFDDFLNEDYNTVLWLWTYFSTLRHPIPFIEYYKFYNLKNRSQEQLSGILL